MIDLSRDWSDLSSNVRRGDSGSNEEDILRTKSVLVACQGVATDLVFELIRRSVAFRVLQSRWPYSFPFFESWDIGYFASMIMTICNNHCIKLLFPVRKCIYLTGKIIPRILVSFFHVLDRLIVWLKIVLSTSSLVFRFSPPLC